MLSDLSQPKKDDVLAKDLNFGGIPCSRSHPGHGIWHQEQQADGDRGRTTNFIIDFFNQCVLVNKLKTGLCSLCIFVKFADICCDIT